MAKAQSGNYLGINPKNIVLSSFQCPDCNNVFAANSGVAIFCTKCGAQADATEPVEAPEVKDVGTCKECGTDLFSSEESVAGLHCTNCGEVLAEDEDEDDGEEDVEVEDELDSDDEDSEATAGDDEAEEEDAEEDDDSEDDSDDEGDIEADVVGEDELDDAEDLDDDLEDDLGDDLGDEDADSDEDDDFEVAEDIMDDDADEDGENYQDAFEEDVEVEDDGDLDELDAPEIEEEDVPLEEVESDDEEEDDSEEGDDDELLPDVDVVDEPELEDDSDEIESEVTKIINAPVASIDMVAMPVSATATDVIRNVIIGGVPVGAIHLGDQSDQAVSNIFADPVYEKAMAEAMTADTVGNVLRTANGRMFKKMGLSDSVEVDAKVEAKVKEFTDTFRTKFVRVVLAVSAGMTKNFAGFKDVHNPLKTNLWKVFADAGVSKPAEAVEEVFNGSEDYFNNVVDKAIDLMDKEPAVLSEVLDLIEDTEPNVPVDKEDDTDKAMATALMAASVPVKMTGATGGSRMGGDNSELRQRLNLRNKR